MIRALIVSCLLFSIPGLARPLSSVEQLQSPDLLVLERNGQSLTFQRCDATQQSCAPFGQLSVQDLESFKTAILQAPAQKFPQKWLNEDDRTASSMRELMGFLGMTVATAYPLLGAGEMALTYPSTWAYLKSSNRLYLAAKAGIIAITLVSTYVTGNRWVKTSRKEALRAHERSKEDLVSILDRMIKLASDEHATGSQVFALPPWVWEKLETMDFSELQAGV